LRKAANQNLAWMATILVPASLVFSYWHIVQGLVHQWLNNEDYSHGLLIVPIAAYLVWQKRAELLSVDIRPDWRALSVLLLAIAVFIVGELGAELFTTRVSMVFFIIGLTWFICGSKVVRVLRFPLAFLFLMIPLPGFVYRNLTFPLQLMSSTGAVGILNILGISAYCEGNVIDLGTMRLQVVEACNGLRYILPLLSLGILFAFFFQKAIWKRILLVLFTVPVAMLANISRIAGTGILAEYWGTRVADGFLHSFSGWVVFMVSLGLLGLFNCILKLIPENTGKQAFLSRTPRGKIRRSLTWPPVAVALTMVLFTPQMVNYAGKVPPLPLLKPLCTFPTEFEGWIGHKSQMDPEIWKRVGGQEYVLIDYHKSGESSLNFYVAYYEYQRKAGDFVHSPRLCLPGSGWFVEENRVRHLSRATVRDGAEQKLQINELVISKNGERQLVYFWYQGRGRNFTNEYAAKIYMVWDGLWRRRTDGALVRLITSLPTGECVDDGRKKMDPFALAAAAALDDFLP
jgi:exosortase D (VPLPA-CTERM-specific)